MSTAKKVASTDRRWCISRPLAERPLLDAGGSGELAGLFKVLANPGRLRLLHALVINGEVRVTDLAGEIEASVQATSNQLQRLVDQGIVSSTRDGSEVRYRIVDPCVPGLIDLAMCLLAETDPP